MKIINKEEFMKMPSGTLYSEFKPCIFNDLMIKGETIGSDYLYMSLIGNVCHEGDFASFIFDRLDNSKDFHLDFNLYSRDGLYDNDAMYAVYDKNDIIGLIDTLKGLIK